jgi:hypothetical protein
MPNKQNTELAYRVRITVQYDAMVFVKPGENVGDRISDIDVPENTQCKYVEDSFEPSDEYERVPDYDEYERVPDYDHLTVEQKAAIRTAAINNYVDGMGCDNVSHVDAAEMFLNTTITDCIASLSGNVSLLDFDPNTGKEWET